MGEVVHLHRDGVSVVVELSHPVPRLLHWGAELDDADAAALPATADGAVLNSSIDQPRRFTVWPTEAEGWVGIPAHEGHADGVATTPRLSTAAARPSEHELTLTLHDSVADLDIEVTYRLEIGGILAVTPTLRRTSAGLYDLASVQALLPVPARATELLDFTGKWCRERAPQRRPLGFGSYVRDSRRGRPGHDSPYLMTLGTPGFGFRSGEVWAVHVAWSGNQRYLAERLPEGAGGHGAVLGGGELLRAGEIRLDDGEAYAAPTTYFGYSADGLDGLAGRFHRMIRSRAVHPTTPRPLMLNTWEAVYFQHDLQRLIRLADAAAAVGVELFVLDDGWFAGRRDHTAGLGDWTVDEAVWPDGLAPLIDIVHGRGMRFGLWVEPEMVNIDSDVAREHPDWLLAPSAGLGPAARHQYLLDLSSEPAWQHVFKRIDRLITQYGLDFLKWDHNRDLLEAVRRGADGDRPGPHAQTTALYRLLDALRERHPKLEIESCASGGARVDLGILARTDRVWASDCNDPIERQQIQRWTAQLLPPELIGAHVGGAISHTTGRTAARSFQLATALFAHAGIEADLTTASDAELEQLAAWARLYRELRPLLHGGRVVRADCPGGGDDEHSLLHGVVSSDGAEAIFAWVQLSTAAATAPGRVPLPGLDEEREYVVRVRSDAGLPSMRQVEPPPWLATALNDGLRVPGRVLTRVGLPMPPLDPGHALVLHLTS